MGCGTSMGCCCGYPFLLRHKALHNGFSGVYTAIPLPLGNRIYFSKLNPSHVANNPSTMLPATYKIKIPYRCCCSICKPSALNAENVVKPPHKPVAKNNLQLASNELLRSETAITIPITKEPIIFTRNVANGKLLCLNQMLNSERSMLPAAPPRPTSRRFLSIVDVIGKKGLENSEIIEILNPVFYFLHSFFKDFP